MTESWTKPSHLFSPTWQQVGVLRACVLPAWWASYRTRRELTGTTRGRPINSLINVLLPARARCKSRRRLGSIGTVRTRGWEVGRSTVHRSPPLNISIRDMSLTYARAREKALHSPVLSVTLYPISRVKSSCSLCWQVLVNLVQLFFLRSTILIRLVNRARPAGPFRHFGVPTSVQLQRKPSHRPN